MYLWAQVDHFPVTRTTFMMLVGGIGDHGGVERSNALAIQAWHEYCGGHGHDLVVISRNDAPGALRMDGIDFYGCSGNRFTFALTAFRLAHRVRPRLMYLGLVSFSPIARVLKRLKRVAAYIVQLHGQEVWGVVPESWRRGLSEADVVVAVSRYTAARAQATAGLDDGAVKLIPLALQPDAPIAAEVTIGSNDLTTLLSVARLDHRERKKGISEVIRALAVLRDRGTLVRYVVVGDGADKPRLEELAGSLSVADEVEFRGSVSEAELSRAFDACDIFVLPSEQEGFGVVFLEAMAHGKAVIAVAAGGVPEVVSDEAAVLLPSPEPDGLAGAIADLASAPEKRAALGAAGLARVRAHFTYERYRRDFHRLINTVAGR